MFHVNEIYFSRVKLAIEGKTKGPGVMQDGALLNIIKNIQKPSRGGSCICAAAPPIRSSESRFFIFFKIYFEFFFLAEQNGILF